MCNLPEYDPIKYPEKRIVKALSNQSYEDVCRTIDMINEINSKLKKMILCINERYPKGSFFALNEKDGELYGKIQGFLTDNYDKYRPLRIDGRKNSRVFYIIKTARKSERTANAFLKRAEKFLDEL